MNHKTIAGALIFAFGEQDSEGLMRALNDMRAHGKPVDVAFALADTAAAALQQVHGDAWRDALNLALLDESAEGALNDSLSEAVNGEEAHS